MKIEKGSSRIVFLIDRYAIKIPNFTYSLEHFLKGWLANIQEDRIWRIFNSGNIEDKTIKLKICPIISTHLWKFILIMPKCLLAKENELPKESSIGNICGDYKVDNYGWYEGKLVCFDYGQ